MQTALIRISSVLWLGIAAPLPAGEISDPCAAFEGHLADLCRESLTLLVEEGDAGRPDVVVSAFGGEKGWRFTLPGKPGAAERCPQAGPLMLPQGARAELRVTARDGLYEWAVPALGIRAVGIPGRISVVAVETGETGTFSGIVVDEAGDPVPGANGDVRVVPPGEFRAGLASSGC